MADINFESSEQSGALARFVSQYWRTVAAGIIAALLAVGGYAWYQESAKQSKINAENELGSIIIAKTGDERMVALESFLKTCPDSVKGAVLLEIARTAQIQRAFDKEADAWNKLSISGPEGMRELAVIGQASAIAQGGDSQKALSILSGFLPKAPKTIQPVVARQMAAIAEESKSWKDALAAYEFLNGASDGQKPYFEAKIAEMKAKL